MDGNKDEAARCVALARSAIAAGDRPRALKLLRIARRLDSTIPLAALLASGQTPTPTPPPPPAPSNQPPTPSATLIGHIKKQTDYYAILGVDRTSSADDIRRAYRQLSLKVHPDKNSAPGAEDAFKSVSKAFKCLMDEDSRRDYDRTASELHVRRQRRSRRFYEDDSPDEIFTSYVNEYRAQRVYRPAAAMGHMGFSFIAFAHIVFVVIMVLCAYLPSDPQYSLQRTRGYGVGRATGVHGVEYFVKSEEFDQMYPPGSSSRVDFERDVVRSYKIVLGQHCHRELQRRRWVRDFATPHCDKLRSIQVA